MSFHLLFSPRPFKSPFSLLPHPDPSPGGGCTEQLFPVAPEVAARVVVGGKLNLNKADSRGPTLASLGLLLAAPQAPVTENRVRDKIVVERPRRSLPSWLPDSTGF